MAQESQNTQFPAGDGSAVAPATPPCADSPSKIRGGQGALNNRSDQPHTLQSTQQSPRPCPQDCNRCGIQQQIYCSTKMLFDLSRAYQEARQQIASMETAIAGIQAQLQSAGTDGQLSTPFIEAT